VLGMGVAPIALSFAGIGFDRVAQRTRGSWSVRNSTATIVFLLLGGDLRGQVARNLVLTGSASQRGQSGG